MNIITAFVCAIIFAAVLPLPIMGDGQQGSPVTVQMRVSLGSLPSKWLERQPKHSEERSQQAHLDQIEVPVRLELNFVSHQVWKSETSIPRRNLTTANEEEVFAQFEIRSDTSNIPAVLLHEDVSAKIWVTIFAFALIIFIIRWILDEFIFKN